MLVVFVFMRIDPIEFDMDFFRSLYTLPSSHQTVNDEKFIRSLLIAERENPNLQCFQNLKQIPNCTVSHFSQVNGIRWRISRKWH